MEKMRYFSLDRIEGETAVLIDEDQCSVIVSLSELPMGAGEGMVYCKIGKEYVRDLTAEDQRRQQVRILQDRLRKRK